MGLPARQRRLEADAEKRPHVARLAEEERRAEQQPDLHAVRVAELEAREHRERAPRRSPRKRGTRPEVAGALDGEIHADLALARLGAEVGEREQPGVAAQGQSEHEPACPTNDRAFIDKRAESRGERRYAQRADEHRHWSVWYYGDGPPVPLIKAAVIGAWVADQVVTLADLEDSTVGNRRPPGGESVVVRGRAAGVFLEAEFLSSSETGAPQAAVTVTIYPDRFLPTVRGIRFFQTPH